MSNRIIAVDFDGTLCENAWPEIGQAKSNVINYVLDQKATGAKLILWTNRIGERLDEAVKWCAAHGLIFDAVNENLPEIIEAFGGDTRKVFANVYLDDHAMLPQVIESRLLSLEEAPICMEFGDDKTLTIEIFWQDLTEKKQKEIEEIIGKDHNYDVFPIATLDVELDAD